MTPRPELTSLVASQWKATPTRSTHHLLNGTSSFSKRKSNPSILDDECVDALRSLLKRARHLDEPEPRDEKRHEPGSHSSGKASSIGSLSLMGPISAGSSSDQPGDKSFVLPSSPGQPAVSVPAVLPQCQETTEAPEKAEVLAEPLQVCEDGPETNSGSRSLEDYENAAFQAIQQKKGGKQTAKNTTKPKPAPCMKRPSASGQVLKRPAAAPQQVAPNEKPTPKHSRKKMLTCWGCIRCRGNVHGCSSCDSDTFAGQRLNGREAWAAYMKKRQQGSN